MTQLEFEEVKERVKKYEKSENLIERLENEKHLISNGILSITTHYQRDIDCANRYAGFHDRLKEKITEFYENEINITRKNMEEI